MIPSPWEFTIVALAGLYAWYLIGEAAILDRPRAWTVDKVGPRLDELISCPWCSSLWLVLTGWAVGWWFFPYETLVIASPFAVMGAIGMLGTLFHALADR